MAGKAGGAALPCYCSMEIRVQVPLSSQWTPDEDDLLLSCAETGVPHVLCTNTVGKGPRYQLVAVKVLAPCSAFSGTVMAGGVGEPCYSLARVEV